MELAEHRPKPLPDPAHARKTAVLDRQAWQQLRAAVQPEEMHWLLPALHKLSAATSRLHYSYQEGTPYAIIALLLISSWAIGVLVGFTNSAQETRHYFVPLLFVVISVLPAQTIRDLDNPALSFIRPNDGNLQDLQRLITQDQLPPSRCAAN